MLQKNFNIIVKNQVDERFITKICEVISNYNSSKSTFSFRKKRELIIKVPKNFNTELFDLSNDLGKKHFNENGFPKHNAIIILPEDKRFRKFTILLQANIFVGYEYISTINHELTHISDYFNLFKISGNIYRGNVNYDDFFFWTEFHAKKEGLRSLILELEKEGKQISLKASKENFLNELTSINSLNKNLYLLTHFFARLSLYDKNDDLNFEIDVFPKEFLINQFGQNIIDYYKVLNQMPSFDEYKRNRKKLVEVLKKIQ